MVVLAARAAQSEDRRDSKAQRQDKPDTDCWAARDTRIVAAAVNRRAGACYGRIVAAYSLAAVGDSWAAAVHSSTAVDSWAVAAKMPAVVANILAAAEHSRVAARNMPAVAADTSVAAPGIQAVVRTAPDSVAGPTGNSAAYTTAHCRRAGPTLFADPSDRANPQGDWGMAHSSAPPPEQPGQLQSIPMIRKSAGRIPIRFCAP